MQSATYFVGVIKWAPVRMYVVTFHCYKDAIVGLPNLNALVILTKLFLMLTIPPVLTRPAVQCESFKCPSLGILP